MNQRPKPVGTYAYRKWWTDRYTMTEIRQMGAAIDFLLNDHSRHAKPPKKKAA